MTPSAQARTGSPLRLSTLHLFSELSNQLETQFLRPKNETNYTCLAYLLNKILVQFKLNKDGK